MDSIPTCSAVFCNSWSTMKLCLCDCWLYSVLSAWYCEIQVFWAIKLMCYFIMHIPLIHNFVVLINGGSSNAMDNVECWNYARRWYIWQASLLGKVEFFQRSDWTDIRLTRSILDNPWRCQLRAQRNLKVFRLGGLIFWQEDRGEKNVQLEHSS